LNGGDILIWSDQGDIDAGRGAKTTLDGPPLIARLGPNDSLLKILPPAVSGSGIAADDGISGRQPQIVLSTPRGLIDAGDAGIRTPGQLFTAANDVVGRDNIDVGGLIGPPAENVVLSADVASVGDTAASVVAEVAEAAAESGGGDTATSESLAASALGWLEVFLEGFGEEFCDSSEGDKCT